MYRALVLVLLALVVLQGVFFALRPQSASEEPQERSFDLTIENGSMTPSEISVTEDEMR